MKTAINIHPELINRINTYATESGSSATTIIGKIKAAKRRLATIKHRRQIRTAPGGYNSKEARRAIGPIYKRGKIAWNNYIRERRRFTAQERDIRRARADKTFRRNLLAKLRRDEARAYRYTPTIIGIEAYGNEESKRRSVLHTCHTIRHAITGRSTPRELPRVTEAILVPITPEEARKMGAKINMAGIAASLTPCIASSHGIHQQAESWKRNGRWENTRAVHNNYVQSFGLIADNLAALDYRANGTTHRIELPAGYEWATDHNGLHVRDAKRHAIDYHPTAGELIAKNAAEKIIARLEKNRARREEMAAKLAAEKADAEGVYVCLADSLQAGNCRAGTLAFGERHGLDATRHYAATELLDIANGDGYRVRLAITAATRRHHIECERGFADLADHAS